MYLNNLSASDIIELNKLNKKYNDNPNLPLEEKIAIKSKILDALEYQDRKKGDEVSTVRNEQHELYNIKTNLEDISSLEGRNYDGYTQKDKIIMAELKENNRDIYDKLTLRLKIDFKKDVICIRGEGDRIAVDRKDYKKIFGGEKITYKESEKIMKKEGKLLIASFFYDLVEHYGMTKEMVIELFDLKNENYWVRYHSEDKSCGRIIHSNNLGNRVPVNSSGFLSDGRTSDIGYLDKNKKAYARFYKVLEERKGGSEIIVR